MKNQQPKIIGVDLAKPGSEIAIEMQIKFPELFEALKELAQQETINDLKEQLAVSQALLNSKIESMEISPGDLVKVRIETAAVTPGFFHHLRKTLERCLPDGCDVLMMSGDDLELCALSDERLASLGLSRIRTTH